MKGIHSQVFRLKWPTHSVDRSTNVETVARRLRYRALGDACRSQGVEHMLFAHHAGDQAETVLLRLYSGYTGTGLRGIKASSEIPECFGIHGISRSGRPRIIKSDNKPALSDVGTTEPPAHLSDANASNNHVRVEDGGVQIHRPLLGFSKSHLYQFCRDKGVTWSEDQTNKDPTLTPRNTIRSLLQSQRLPRVLQTAALQQTAALCSSKNNRHEEIAARIYDACEISLDVRSGYTCVRFPDQISNMLVEGLDQGADKLTAQRRAACLIRRIAMLVTPQPDLSLQEVQAAVRISFPDLFEGHQERHSNRVSFSKVIFTVGNSLSADPEQAKDKQDGTKHGCSSLPSSGAGLSCVISRAPPTREETRDYISSTDDNLKIGQGELDRQPPRWTLFDGRFWIRFSHGSTKQGDNITTNVRFLTADDIRHLNDRLKHSDCLKQLGHLLKTHAPAKIRFTLPAIVERSCVVTAGVTSERVVALPSLGWSCAGWQKYDSHKHSLGDPYWWDFRYKKIDLKQDVGI